MKNKIFFYNFVWKVKSNQPISHVHYILPTFMIKIIIIILLIIFFTGLQRDEHAEVVGHGQGSLLCFARGQGRLFIIVLIIVIIIIITMSIKIILRLQFTVMPVLGGLGCSWPATLSTTSGNSFSKWYKVDIKCVDCTLRVADIAFFIFRVRSNDAIRYVRLKRPNMVETRL